MRADSTTAVTTTAILAVADRTNSASLSEWGTRPALSAGRGRFRQHTVRHTSAPDHITARNQSVIRAGFDQLPVGGRSNPKWSGRRYRDGGAFVAAFAAGPPSTADTERLDRSATNDRNHDVRRRSSESADCVNERKPVRAAAQHGMSLDGRRRVADEHGRSHRRARIRVTPRSLSSVRQFPAFVVAALDCGARAALGPSVQYSSYSARRVGLTDDHEDHEGERRTAQLVAVRCDEARANAMHSVWRRVARVAQRWYA